MSDVFYLWLGGIIYEYFIVSTHKRGTGKHKIEPEAGKGKKDLIMVKMDILKVIRFCISVVLNATTDKCVCVCI